MTGLFNRIGIERVYKTICESNSPFYLIVCDLDGMKKINDKYGHLQGDKYIISTAKIISDAVGEKGYVARIGGDEFVIILEYQDIHKVKQILLEIRQLVNQLFSEKNTGISLGYSLFPYDGDNLEELIKVADKKMYNDKASRKIHA